MRQRFSDSDALRQDLLMGMRVQSINRVLTEMDDLETLLDQCDRRVSPERISYLRSGARSLLDALDACLRPRKINDEEMPG